MLKKPVSQHEWAPSPTPLRGWTEALTGTEKAWLRGEPVETFRSTCSSRAVVVSDAFDASVENAYNFANSTSSTLLHSWALERLEKYTMSPIAVLLIAPLVVGGIVAAANSSQVNETTEKAESWIRTQENRRSGSSGWFSGYVLYPLLWTNVRFCNWTDDFDHRGLKNGTRVAGSLYLLGFWLFILYLAFSLIVGIIILGGIIYVLGAIFSDSDGGTRTSSTRSQSKSSESTSSGIFTSYECDHCGSTDHATSECPNSGVFTSNECDHCGSTEHATADCPNSSVFTSNECDHCGSPNHATADCPNSGVFTSNECDHCGSTDHATAECPNSGIFTSNECDYCGSTEHATAKCLH